MTELTKGTGTVAMDDFLSDPGGSAVKVIATTGDINAEKLATYLEERAAFAPTGADVSEEFSKLARKIKSGWRP